MRLAERVGNRLLCVATGSPWITDPIVYFYGDFSTPPLSEVTETTRRRILARRSNTLHLLPAGAGVSPDELKARMAEKSILNHANAIESPTFFATSDGDEIVPHRMVVPLMDRLREKGLEVRNFKADRAPHGFYLNVIGEGSEEEHTLARQAIVQFLAEYLDSSSP